MYKENFFNENPEALTEMKRIIDTNPDTWPQVIKAQYGIIIDEHFWENNPLSDDEYFTRIAEWVRRNKDYTNMRKHLKEIDTDIFSWMSENEMEDFINKQTREIISAEEHVSRTKTTTHVGTRPPIPPSEQWDHILSMIPQRQPSTKTKIKRAKERLFPNKVVPGSGIKAPVTYGRVRGKSGGALDIHKAILKVAPRKGFVLPGHRYTRPGNPLDSQLKYDPETGEILEIYEQPTGRTDAVSMQHDLDCSVCGNKPKREQVKCKNKADRKMVAALDAIRWRERQWGDAVARTMINTKQKLGLGFQTKNASRR